MSEDDDTTEEIEDELEIEGLADNSTEVFEAGDEEWPPENESNGGSPPPTTDGDAAPDGQRSGGDPTPARSHRFAPDAIESMLADDSKIPSLITLTGPHAGETRRLSGDRILLGRHRDEVDVWFGDPGVSRRHAAIERADDGSLMLRDLGSSNGTYVNGEKLRGPRKLEDGDKIVLSKRAIVKFSLQDPLDEQFQQHMYESSVRDGLTDAYSRAYLDEQLRSEMAFDERHDTDTALLLLDIDHFKRVNDEYGHPVGDAVLVGVAEVARTEIRAEDLVARYGGEEFAILLRNTDREGIRRVAERLREAIGTTTFEVHDARVEITVSVGGALYTPAKMDEPEDWVFAADRALYDAKSSGRNRARIFEGSNRRRTGNDTPPIRP